MGIQSYIIINHIFVQILLEKSFIFIIIVTINLPTNIVTDLKSNKQKSDIESHMVRAGHVWTFFKPFVNCQLKPLKKNLDRLCSQGKIVLLLEQTELSRRMLLFQ